MRRLWMVAVGLLVITGCADFRRRFTSHANVAAEAGDQELSAERLAAFMRAGKGAPISAETAELVANIWVDYALFADAVVNGKLVVDSATTTEAMWPEIAEARSTQWHGVLAAQRDPIGAAAADSVYGGKDVRVLQHILFRLPPNAPPAARAAARKQADQALARIKRGVDFGEVASKLSQDPGSARDSGFLPPSPRGAFVPAFDSAGWSLAPGQVSGVVETQFGYHIIKRPTMDAVRQRLLAWVNQNAAGRLDSLYMDSLAQASKLKISADAPATMRNALKDLDDARDSKKRLAEFQGGGLTVTEYARWVRALPPPYRTQLEQATDTALIQFAHALATNVLLLRQADSAKIRLSPAEWQTMQQRFSGQVDTLGMEMQVVRGDSSLSASERQKLAGERLQRYFDDLLAGKLRIRPLPSTLGAVLRERSDYHVNAAGIKRAVEIARAEQAKAGPGNAPGGAPPGAPPGPAPVPPTTPAPAPPAGADSGARK